MVADPGDDIAGLQRIRRLGAVDLPDQDPLALLVELELAPQGFVFQVLNVDVQDRFAVVAAILMPAVIVSITRIRMRDDSVARLRCRSVCRDLANDPDRGKAHHLGIKSSLFHGKVVVHRDSPDCGESVAPA
jgi:hypothetical protein